MVRAPQLTSIWQLAPHLSHCTAPPAKAPLVASPRNVFMRRSKKTPKAKEDEHEEQSNGSGTLISAQQGDKEGSREEEEEEEEDEGD